MCREPAQQASPAGDHVAPRRSACKIHFLADTDVTFVLTGSGHNAGIVSEPGHRGWRFRVATKRMDDQCLDAEEWAAVVERKEGSWWEEWVPWLAARSTSEPVPSPPMGAADKGYAPVGDAPGTYVFQR